jgi:hypothetical protein
MTVRQNNLLQTAIDNVPCKFSRYNYFDDEGDACIIGYLSTIAPASADSKKILEVNNGESISDYRDNIKKVAARIMRAFGLASYQLSHLQRTNDSMKYKTKHARCVGVTKELKAILEQAQKGE